MDLTIHRGYVNGDFDDYITAGTWAYGGGAMHDPGVGWGMLRVSPGYYITQEFFSDKTFSTRTKTEKNVWTDWKTYITKTDLTNLFKPGAVLEVGQYIDFHAAGSTGDYDGRLYIDENTNDLIYRVGNVKYKLNTTVV